jgi:uncharacterized Zn ribbon protein
MSKHKGPVCKQCGSEFYYDYIPQRHDFSGYCRECYADWERIRAAAHDVGSPSHPEVKP